MNDLINSANDFKMKPFEKQRIPTYFNCMTSAHHRYKSWECCYTYFRSAEHRTSISNDHAALHLGFYLASWGMYRGSSFLLQYSYAVHCEVVKLITHQDFSDLWIREFGAGGKEDADLLPLIFKALESIKNEYKKVVVKMESCQPTDTLLTKVILGTFGCLPACDRYFIDGFKNDGKEYRNLLSRQNFDRFSKLILEPIS